MRTTLDPNPVLVASASDAFLLRNNHRSREASLAEQRHLLCLYREAGLAAGPAYVFTAFGCNYEGDVPVARVVECAGDLLAVYTEHDLTPPALYLCDTVGAANPKQRATPRRRPAMTLARPSPRVSCRCSAIGCSGQCSRTASPTRSTSVGEALARRPRREWLALLVERGVPCSPLNTIEELSSGEHAAARGILLDYETPELGALRGVGLPIQFEGEPRTMAMPPPLLGQHTAEVLGELGYSPEAIAALSTS